MERSPASYAASSSFALAKTGNLENAVLALPDGTSLPVVGQATGHALQVRIDLGQRLALVAVGVGEQEIAACQGAVDGLASGPDVGDLGDWHAAALRKADGAGAGAGEPKTGGKKGGKKDSAPAGGAGAGAAEGGRTGRGGRKEQPPASEQTGSAPANGTTGPAGGTGATGPAGPSGPTATTGATGASGPSGATAGQAACASGLTYCGTACVDLMSDLNNCGACGSICESQLVPVECRQGICERATCEVGIEYCGAVDGCRDLNSDPLHCGACQHPCATGESCVNGFCAGTCAQGLTNCNGVCVDLNSDDENCGACGNVCGQVPNNPGVYTYCEGGVCVAPQCPQGTTDCANYCADLMTSMVHCGACGVACAAGELCVNGVCTPPAACAQQGQPCGAGGCCVGFCGQDEICECVTDGFQCAGIGTGGCCSGQPCNADGFCGTCALFGGACNADAECCSGQYGAALCCFDGVSLGSVCTDVTNIGFVCPGEALAAVTGAARG